MPAGLDGPHVGEKKCTGNIEYRPTKQYKSQTAENQKIRGPDLKTGEMAEWSKAHAWKVCIPHKGIKGSNPFFSAMMKNTKQRKPFDNK